MQFNDQPPRGYYWLGIPIISFCLLGVQRTRLCTPALYGGVQCPPALVNGAGNPLLYQSQACNTDVCTVVVPGGYSDWSEWSNCSSSCPGDRYDTRRVDGTTVGLPVVSPWCLLQWTVRALCFSRLSRGCHLTVQARVLRRQRNTDPDLHKSNAVGGSIL